MQMPLDCQIHAKKPELILCVYGRGVLSVQDVDGFSSFFNTHLKGDTPFKVLFDLRKLNSASANAIKPLVKCMTSFESLSQGKVVASSVLVSSPTIESILNFLFSLNKPTTPTKVTSDLTQACDFLNEFDCTTF